MFLFVFCKGRCEEKRGSHKPDIRDSSITIGRDSNGGFEQENTSLEQKGEIKNLRM